MNIFPVILTEGYIKSAHLKKGENGSEDDCAGDLPMNYSSKENRIKAIVILRVAHESLQQVALQSNTWI